MPQHGEGQVGATVQVVVRYGERVVGGVVVLHQHLGEFGAHLGRDAIEYVDEGCLGVVRHDEHPDLHRRNSTG